MAAGYWVMGDGRWAVGNTAASGVAVTVRNPS
jgi:hypothetical protein